MKLVLSRWKASLPTHPAQATSEGTREQVLTTLSHQRNLQRATTWLPTGPLPRCRVGTPWAEKRGHCCLWSQRMLQAMISVASCSPGTQSVSTKCLFNSKNAVFRKQGILPWVTLIIVNKHLSHVVKCWMLVNSGVFCGLGQSNLLSSGWEQRRSEGEWARHCVEMFTRSGSGGNLGALIPVPLPWANSCVPYWVTVVSKHSDTSVT